MKNSIFFLFCFLLSFSVFGVYLDDYVLNINTVRVYTFSDGTNVTYSQMTASSLDSVYVIYASRPFGFVMTRTTQIFSPSVPSSTNDFGSSSIGYQVQATTIYNNAFRYYSPRSFSRVDSLFNFAFSLASQGYDGPGLDLMFSGPRSYYNFDYKTAVANILSSTNSVYRRLVLSHLSTISSNVASIDSSVLSISNLVGAISSSVQPDPFQVDFVSAVRTLQSTSSLGGIDYDGIILEYNDLPTSEARSLFARGFSRLFDSQKSAQGLLNGLRASPSDLSEIGSRFNKGVSDILNGGVSAGGGIAGDIKRLSTNDWASVVTNQLAQNTRDAKQQLKDNHDSITNQLAHMFDDNPNSVGRAIRNTANNTAASATAAGQIANALSGTLSVHVTDTVGVSLDGPVDINNSQFQDVTVPLGNVSSTLSNFYNDWYRFWDISTPAYSWGNFYNMVRDFKDQNHVDISSITNLPFFSAVSNSLASIDNFLQTNSFSSSLHALLLDDYADYITNRFYSSAVDTFKDDYPSVYTNLVKFGLSTNDGEGNFWSLISSTLFYQSALVCGMLEDLATVRQFADDHIEGGFSCGVTSLIEKMPSSTELADRVNMASNEVLKIEAAANSFYTSYGTMTNTAFSAFSPFRGIFSSVPENIVFFKTGNEQYITIPVSRGGNAWSVIRLCFSFSLVAVNVILFPKFVLMVIVLLSKLSKRFVKFVPTDAM